MIVLFLLIVALWSITPLANSNAYLASNVYGSISVKSGDTVWGIAAKYVSDQEDVRELAQAIKEVNGLNHNVQIFPGQVLKIPLKQ